MAFSIGSPVLVKSIGKTGRVVEASRGGRYRVQVGGVLMACREADLAPATDSSRRRYRRRAAVALPNSPNDAEHLLRPPPSRSERRCLVSLDLHGLTVEEAVRAVEERLDAALLAGVERLEIIHGRSSGRIKVAVHRLLRELTVVRRFEVARENPGMTRVYL